MIASLSGCSETRRENIDYFQSVTGMKLCRNSVIKNNDISKNDFEKDFTYSVIIYNNNCDIDIFNQIKDLNNYQCGENNCRGFDNYGNYYFANEINNNTIKFVYRSTS